QPLDRVGDLQLVAPRGTDCVHRLEHVAVKNVDADQGQIAGRLFRLLHQPHNLPIGPHFGHAILARVRDAGQHDLAVHVQTGELANQGVDATLDDVVAQKHDEAVIAEE